MPKLSIQLDSQADHKVIDQSKLLYEFKAEELPVPATPGAKYTTLACPIQGSARGILNAIEFIVPQIDVQDTHWSGPMDTTLAKFGSK